MSRGTNSWHGCGAVVSDVRYNNTKGGDLACSFRIAINQPYKNTLYIRVNVYGGNVVVCERRKLVIGDFVVIDGELMNRRGNDEVLIEIRCREIVIVSSAKE